MSSEPAELELLGIHKRFDRIAALDGAAFTLRAASIHGLLGENGAGKTSLMRVAYGVLALDAGVMRIRGREVRLRSPGDALRLGIGMVQQHFSLVPQLTAVENFALGGRGTLHLPAERERLTSAAERLGFSISLDVPAAAMSPAEQQQLELLKAIAKGGRVLILDEPTAALPPLQATRLLELLRGLARQGMAIVLITHKLRDVFSVADEVTVLRKGRTVLSAPVADVDRDTLVRAMLGESPMAAASDRDVPNVASPRFVARLQAVSAEGRQRQEALHDVSLDVQAGETKIGRAHV